MTSLSGRTVRILAGWGRMVQGSTLSVQSTLLLPPFPSRLDSGPPATVPRLTPFFMTLNGIPFTLKTCAFESITLFSDSLSVLLTVSAPLPYLTPKSLSDTQSLLNVLSESKVVHFQWIPGHSYLPGNDLADSLDPYKISVSLSPLNSSHRLSLYTSSKRSVQSSLFHHQIPPVFPEELTLPRSACCALSRLRCNGHSTLLGIYLHRLGRAETPSCSNCGSE